MRGIRVSAHMSSERLHGNFCQPQKLPHASWQFGIVLDEIEDVAERFHRIIAKTSLCILNDPFAQELVRANRRRRILRSK